ncbi:MAG: GTP-binding protein [Crocinitomicaceae bacterium]
MNKNADFIHSYLPGHIYVKIHPLRQHFWSPQLHLSLEQDADKVIIRGLYGPNPTVWAIFFFSYVALGILSLFLGMWGLTRWSLGMDHAILWAIPVFAVIAVILYLSAQAGQKLGAQQMFDIHHFYEAIAEDRIEID